MNAANVAKAIAPPPANPFSTKKEIRRGEISEKGKGGGWWGASAFGRIGGAAQAAILAEMGSDFSVKSHQRKNRGYPRFLLWL